MNNNNIDLWTDSTLSRDYYIMTLTDKLDCICYYDCSCLLLYYCITLSLYIAIVVCYIANKDDNAYLFSVYV